MRPNWDAHACRCRRPPAYSPAMNTRALLAILAAVIAVLLGSQLLFSLSDWNRQQACATGGGRNCAPSIRLNQQ